jgi:hypothetical protein
MVAAADQDYHATRDELAALLPVVRALLAGRFTEIEAVTDVWLTLLCQDRRNAAFLAATAIVQLAKETQPRGRMASEPGS